MEGVQQLAEKRNRIKLDFPVICRLADRTSAAARSRFYELC
jgi:hypothetical protein